MVLAGLMWGCTLAFQIVYLDHPASNGLLKIDSTFIDYTQSKQAAAPALLFCLMGAVSAMWQSLAYWLIGVITDDTQSLTRYAGFYKCIQSLGAVVAWQLEAQSVSLLTQIIVNWSLVVLAIPSIVYFVSSVEDDYDVEAEQKKFKIYPPNFIDIA
ncbi:hypothetical protein IW143_004080 [Coemansia sp. RSA 520]|nr:hypothetical protein IW143_004080 [Coemansia sp. RSA 520]